MVKPVKKSYYVKPGNDPSCGVWFRASSPERAARTLASNPLFKGTSVEVHTMATSASVAVFTLPA